MRRGYFFKLYHHADGKAKETMGVPVVFGRFRSFSVVFSVIPGFYSDFFPFFIPFHSFSFLNP